PLRDIEKPVRNSLVGLESAVDGQEWTSVPSGSERTVRVQSCRYWDAPPAGVAAGSRASALSARAPAPHASSVTRWAGVLETSKMTVLRAKPTATTAAPAEVPVPAMVSGGP